MIHSKLSSYIELENEKISIREAAKKTIQLFRELAKSESKFSIIKVISETKTLKDAIDISQEVSIKLLAEEILNANRKELEKKDNTANISIDYSNAEILHYAVTSEYRENESIVTLFFSFTTSKWLDSKIGSIVSHHNYFSNRSNCIDFIKASVKVFNPKYAIIRPTNDREFTKALKKYKHNSKFGNFTYFKNELEYKIPNDIDSVYVENMEEGKLYYLNSFDNLEDAKQEIIYFMESFEQIDKTILKE